MFKGSLKPAEFVCGILTWITSSKTFFKHHVVKIKHWIQLVDLTPSCLNYSLLSRNSMGLTKRLSRMAYEGLVAQPLPAPHTLSTGSRNTGLLSISRTNLGLCCCPMRTGPSHAALEAARPLPHHSTEASLGSWPTGSLLPRSFQDPVCLQGPSGQPVPHLPVPYLSRLQ